MFCLARVRATDACCDRSAPFVRKEMWDGRGRRQRPTLNHFYIRIAVERGRQETEEHSAWVFSVAIQ
jgi:hypothetical protein